MPGLRALILHGWHGSGPDHWQTWLAGRLRDAGAHVQYPALPDCEVPCPDRWGAALHREVRALAKGDGERVVIAHSLGCVLWLREAAEIRPEHRVDRVVLVAPPCPGAGHLNVEAGYGPWPAMEAWALGDAEALETRPSPPVRA